MTSWTNYATSIGSTWNLNGYGYGGVYIEGDKTGNKPLGFIELSLPAAYEHVTVYWYAASHGVVDLLVDGILQQTATGSTTLQQKTYQLAYNASKVLRIQEDTGLIGENLRAASRGGDKRES